MFYHHVTDTCHYPLHTRLASCAVFFQASHVDATCHSSPHHLFSTELYAKFVSMATYFPSRHAHHLSIVQDIRAHRNLQQQARCSQRGCPPSKFLRRLFNLTQSSISTLSRPTVARSPPWMKSCAYMEPKARGSVEAVIEGMCLNGTKGWEEVSRLELENLAFGTPVLRSSARTTRQV